MNLFKKSKKDKGKETKTTLKDHKDPKLYPSTGYIYTPSFARANNQFATITKLTNHFGQNRNQTYGWFVNILPEINVDDVKGYFIEVSKPLTDSEQKKIMSKSDATLEALDEDNQPTKGNHGQKELNELHKHDIHQANKFHRRQDKAIDSKKHLLLVSKNPDNISEQLKALNDYYQEDHAGLKLESDAGDQENLFKQLLTPPSGNIYEETMMSAGYAGFDHAVRRGLNDDKGVAIGELTASLTNGSAMMDLNGSFKNKILISSTKTSHIYKFDEKLSASSMWGQKVANHAMAYGHKTFHIVLNDFDYYGEANMPGKTKTFSAEPIMNSVLKKINLASGGLNPLQLFGDTKDQIQIYHNHLDKLVYQFYLFTNRTMDRKMIPNLRKELSNFYETKGIWNNEAYKYPGRIRILNKRANSYPTFDQFLLSLSNYADETADAGSHKVQDAEDMVTSLETVLDTHYSTINTYTTLPDPDEPDVFQYYYRLNELEGDIKEAQFLNAFDYIAYAAQENDIIMIHGIDQLSTETARYIKRTLGKIENNGIRTAYLFDLIGRKQLDKDSESKSEGINNIEYCDIFNTNGIFYEDIENEFDYTILGTMSKNDLYRYEHLIKQTLPAELRNIMTATKERDQFQIRRPEDFTSNFVWGNFVL